MSKKTKQKIVPFLWFDNRAEEAVKFYTSIFKNSRALEVMRYGDAGPGKKGDVMAITFQLEGQQFVALNGNTFAPFNMAISLFVNCKTQAEVDRLWKKLLAGGEHDACGWLRDKFGVSWQIVPDMLLDLIQDKDPAKSARVMKAMMDMIKLDIATLKRAHKGK